MFPFSDKLDLKLNKEKETILNKEFFVPKRIKQLNPRLFLAYVDCPQAASQESECGLLRNYLIDI